MDGKGLSELRRSGAAGPHGKKTPDRANTEREAVNQALIDDGVLDGQLSFDDEGWAWE